MKKLCWVIVFVLLLNLFPLIPMSVSAGGTIGECTWQLNGTELTITGEGDMGEYSNSPWGTGITKVTIGEGVTTINNYAFSGCKALKTAKLPNTLKVIGGGAFYDCSSLEEISIPECVISIGERAFYGCKKLIDVQIPKSVTSIGECAFSVCEALQAITVDKGNPNYCTVDGVLFNKNKTTLMQYPCLRMATSYTIPDTVTKIDMDAFSYARLLSDISIPDGVTKIGYNPFFNTRYSNNSSNYVDGILYLGKHIIATESNRSVYVVADGTLTIADGAFVNCNKVENITLPEGLITIGDSAFSWCSSLEKIYIPKSVKTIGESAFYDTNLSEIYYGGTSEDRKRITVERYNEELDTVKWNYNACSSLDEHIFEGSTVIMPPSCTANGQLEKQCVVCSKKFKETIPPKAHVYDNATDPDCNECGAVRTITPAKKNGWVSNGGKWYYYENDVMVKNAWRRDSVGWVYLAADGAMKTNAWVRDSIGWCYVGANGYAVTNCWKKDSVGWCYLNASGSMTKNAWVKDGGKLYYVNASGYKVIDGWARDSKGWVYLGSDGTKVINKWVRDSIGWCYVGADGYAVTNCWKKDSVGWCYLNASGSMTKNAWVNDGGNRYYLNGSGYRVTGTKVIGGKTYKFNSNGILVS